jgi:hypothetical protein
MKRQRSPSQSPPSIFNLYGNMPSLNRQPEPRAVTIKKRAEDLIKEHYQEHRGYSGMINKIIVRHVYHALCDATNLDDNDEHKKDIIEVLIYDYQHIKTGPAYGTKERTLLMYTIHQFFYPEQSINRRLHESCDPALILNTLIASYNRNRVGKEKFSMNEKVYTDGDTDLIRLVKPGNWERTGSLNYPDKMPELIDIISEITDLDLRQENDNGKPAFLVLVENIEPCYQKNKSENLNKMRNMAYCIISMLNTATQLIRNDKTTSYTLRTQQHLQSAIKSMIKLIPIIDEIHNYLHEVVEDLEQGWDDLFFEIILNIPRDLELSKYSKKLNIVMKNRIFKACIEKYLRSCLEDRDYFEDNQDLTTAAINSMGNIPSNEEYFKSIRDNALNNLQAEYGNRILDARATEQGTGEGISQAQQIVDEEQAAREELKNTLQIDDDGMPTEEANSEFLNQANEQGVGAPAVERGIISNIMQFSSPSGRDVQAPQEENIQDPFCNFVLRTANNDNIHDIVEGIHNSIELYIGNRISINTDTITNNKTILGMLYEIISVYRRPFLIEDVIYNCLYRPLGIVINNEDIHPKLREIFDNLTNDIPSKEEFINFHENKINELQQMSNFPNLPNFLLTAMMETPIGDDYTVFLPRPNELELFRENEPQTVGFLCIRMYEKVLREHLYNSFFERMSTYEGFNEIISVEGEQINIVENPVFVSMEDSIYDEYLRNNNNGGKKRTHKNKSLKKNKKGQKNKRTKKNIGKKMTKKVKKNAKKKSKKRSVR